MAWIPTLAKIYQFGKAWVDTMIIPETTDPVLGEDDPGAGQVTMAAMGSASGQAFAYMENNLQYIRDTIVFDDITINVSDVATLQAALDVLDMITYVHKGVTVEINMAAATYAWPVPGTETRPAINVEGIHGPGSVVFNAAGGANITGNCTSSRPLLRVKDCTCNVSVTGSIVLVNDLAAGTAWAAEFDNIRNASATGLDVRNDSSGDTLAAAVYCVNADYVRLGLTANTTVGSDTGIDYAIHARYNSVVHVGLGAITLGELTGGLLKLEKNSEVALERFDGLMPTGANMAAYDYPVNADDTSRVTAGEISATGQGLEDYPYILTIPWESATDTPRLIRNTLRTLPQPLDVWVQLKLPAGTMTGLIDVSNLHGGGGVILEANTKLSSRGTSQDTIVDAALSAIQIWRCDLPVHLHSISADNAGGVAAIDVRDSEYVKIEYCLVRAAAGQGVSMDGHRCDGMVAETLAGTCGGSGVYAINGAVIKTINIDDLGATLPALYGQYAFDSGVIYSSSTTGQYMSGTLGVSFENQGGKVHTS